MAAAVVIDSADGRYVQGSRAVRKGTITLNTYATNGVAVTAALFELPGTIAELDIGPSGGLIFEWDKTNSKIKAFYPTGGATASPAALAAPQVTTGASTASAVNATTPALTPGVAKEVLNATDLSSITTRFRVEGY